MQFATRSQPAAFPMPRKLEEGSVTERVQIVAPSSWLQRIEEWRRKQPRIPNRSEAIRILVDLALDAQERRTSSSKSRHKE